MNVVWRGVMLFLAVACMVQPASAASYMWTIFDLDGVAQEKFTFTTPLDQVWPDSASEITFLDSAEWPSCGFFFADSRHFDCSTDLTDQQVMNLSALLGSTWQLGLNPLFDGSIRENLFDTDTNNGFQSLSVLIETTGSSPSQPVAAPEPGTMAVLLAGLVLITLSLRRRSSKTNR